MTSVLGEPVEHRQLKDSVYLKLRQEIVTATLPPGYVLREAELAARFGVSKTPLREAFVRLEKDGFVQIAPYRSAVVTGYSQQDLREIYEVRELLEGLCAREAAVSIATEDLAALNRIVRDSAAAFDAGDTDRLTALLDEFDVVLYAQSRNSRITAMLENIRDHVTRIGRLTVAIPGRMGTSVRGHQAIYEAIVQRDGPRAETLMRQHILSVMADQLASLDPDSVSPQ
jgi:DNA-binding GntR family transcriptional regulator